MSGKGEIQSLVNFRAGSGGKETTSGLNSEMDGKEFLLPGTFGNSVVSFGTVYFGNGLRAFTISSFGSLNIHWNTRLVGELSPHLLLLRRCSAGDSAWGELVCGHFEDDCPSSHAPLELSITSTRPPEDELASDEVLRLLVDLVSSHIISGSFLIESARDSFLALSLACFETDLRESLNEICGMFGASYTSAIVVARSAGMLDCGRTPWLVTLGLRGAVPLRSGRSTVVLRTSKPDCIKLVIKSISSVVMRYVDASRRISFHSLGRGRRDALMSTLLFVDGPTLFSVEIPLALLRVMVAGVGR